MNQPIEEKWKIDYKKDFVSGDAYTRHPQETINFIENLLEQERKRMSEEIERMRGIGRLGIIPGRVEDFVPRDKVLSIINK